MDLDRFLLLSNQRELVRAVLNLTDLLMTTQNQLAATLANITTQVTKVGEETKTLLVKIDELKTAVEAAGNVSPEVQTALDALMLQVQVVDDLVPDAAGGEGTGVAG